VIYKKITIVIDLKKVQYCGKFKSEGGEIWLGEKEGWRFKVLFLEL
jgi:hypothetical protein